MLKKNTTKISTSAAAHSNLNSSVKPDICNSNYKESIYRVEWGNHDKMQLISE